MKISKLTPAIGAILDDVVLDDPLPDATADALYAALMEHLVIFIRGVEITPAAHLAFAQSFGALDDPHLAAAALLLPPEQAPGCHLLAEGRPRPAARGGLRPPPGP